MIIEFVGKTRTLLTDEGRQLQVEDILRRLGPGLLGGEFYSSSDVGEDVPLAQRRCIALESTGWLASEFRAEMAIRKQSKDRWLTPVMQEQFGLTLPAFLHGSLYFVTSDYDVQQRNKGKEVFIDASERALVKRGDDTVFDNRVAIKWLGAAPADIPLVDVCTSAMKVLFDNEIFDYGYCCLADEYQAKNIDRTNGARAVGLDVSKCLPGFYWGNYFGQYLCDRIGLERLVAVRGCRSYTLQGGVLVTNGLPPDCWNQAAYTENADGAIATFGPSLFFRKGFPCKGTLFAPPEEKA